MRNRILLTFSIPFLFFIFFVVCFFTGKADPAEKIVWGVNFSQKHAANLGLDWREAYLALFDDLGSKNLKLITHWDLLEPEKDRYSLEDLDWQISEAKKRNIKVILTVGMKTGRWPECHIPDWAKNLSREEQQDRILKLIEKIARRYANADSEPNFDVGTWQVENEPLFTFGECPWIDKNFLKKEIALVKSLDAAARPIIISDSGEFSFWFEAGKLGDIIGVTMYQRVWHQQLGFYIRYPFSPAFYWRKAELAGRIFNKKVIVIELQAEPWGPKLLYDLPIEEQKKTMDIEKFKYQVNFARSTGLDEFYFWGVEWWYWLKEKQLEPEIWEEAKKLFR